MKKLYSILFVMMLALSSIANAQGKSNGVSTDYSGYLNIAMTNPETGESGLITENAEKTITITEYADGTCDFLLPNFVLSTEEDDMELGDILVEGAIVTKNEEGVATYNGYIENMPLLDGAIEVEVTLNGAISADAVVDMKIDVLWMEIPIACTFTTNKVKFGESTDYPGYLNIAMTNPETGESGLITENAEKTITITEYTDGTCDFLLPNFVLSTEEDDMELGDILVEGATVTKGDDGISTYAGEIKDMPLLEGSIVADVTLNGTISATGVVDMKIDVVWMGIPIECTFTSEQSGIENIEINENGSVVYYNLQGVKVANPENGVFIRVQGGKASKVAM